MAIVADTNIHIGDVGTAFVCTIKNNDEIVVLTNTSGSFMLGFKKPDKTEIWVTANLFSDGNDGKIKYVTSNKTFFDKGGTWYVTAWVKQASGEWTATAKAFRVRTAFET